MGPGTWRKLRPLRIMVDMMVSIMRAWGWDDLCKVMAAIQRLKRPRTTCSSQCALEGPSSFLIQNLASPWVEVVGLSNLASPPTCAFTARGGGGYLHCTPTHTILYSVHHNLHLGRGASEMGVATCTAPPHAHPPCCYPSCLQGSGAASRHQLSSFGPILLNYLLAQPSRAKKFIL